MHITIMFEQTHHDWLGNKVNIGIGGWGSDGRLYTANKDGYTDSWGKQYTKSFFNENLTDTSASTISYSGGDYHSADSNGGGLALFAGAVIIAGVIGTMGMSKKEKIPSPPPAYFYTTTAEVFFYNHKMDLLGTMAPGSCVVSKWRISPSTKYNNFTDVTIKLPDKGHVVGKVAADLLKEAPQQNASTCITSYNSAPKVTYNPFNSIKKTETPYRVLSRSQLSALPGKTPLKNVFVESGSCVSIDENVLVETGKSAIVAYGQSAWSRALIDTKNITVWKDFPAHIGCNPNIITEIPSVEKTGQDITAQPKDPLVATAEKNTPQIEKPNLADFRAIALGGHSYIVTAEKLNIRSEPNAQSRIVGQTSRTSCLIVYGEASGTFLPVYGRKDDGSVFNGYASSKYLRKTPRNKETNCGASLEPAP